MIHFRTADGVFNYRVAGLCIQDGWVLLHRMNEDPFWTVPGGRCEMLEPSAEALKREMREELDVDVRIERSLWLVENFFEYEGTPFHEICLYFLIALPSGSPYTDKEQAYVRFELTGTQLLFRWFRIDELREIVLLPSFLAQGLADIPDTVQHMVHVDKKSTD